MPKPGDESAVPFNRNDPLARVFLGYTRVLARYHRHRVLHLERIETLRRRGRRVVLVGNHALDVLDPLLFTAALIDRYNRLPHFVGHENLIFRMPALGALARRYQMIPSRRMRETAAALRTSGLLMLYPGSGSEAARRSYRDEPYRLKWERRLGFLQLALRYDAEILFVAAVGIDEMYYQSSLTTPTWLLRLFSGERYEGSRMQFGVLGPHLVPTLLPFPVQITHVVSNPLRLGDRAAARRSRRALARLHQRVVAQCQTFLDAAVAQRERDARLLDRVIRGGERIAQRIGI